MDKQTAVYIIFLQYIHVLNHIAHYNLHNGIHQLCFNKTGENPVDLYHGILLNNRKEQTIDMRNFNVSKLHYVEWKKAHHEIYNILKMT